jgi:hypothetical protein
MDMDVPFDGVFSRLHGYTYLAFTLLVEFYRLINFL